MKKLIITCIMLIAAAVTTNAQTLASAAPIPEKEEAAVPAAPAPTVKYVAPSVQTAAMNIGEGYVYFSNMPERGEVTMYLTDDRGNVLNKKMLNARRSNVDISKLDKGVHFITLHSETSGLKKTFMLSLQ